MNEETFMMCFSIIAEIELIMQAVFITAFVSPFMAEKEGGHKAGRKYSLFLLYAAVNSAALLSFVQGWICMTVVLLVFTLFSAFWGMSKGMAFYLNVLFHGLKYLSMLTTESVNYFSSEFFLRKADTPEKVFIYAVGNYLFITVFRLALFSVMLYVVRHILKRQKAALHMSGLCYLLLMPAMGILFVRIIFRLLIVADEDFVFQLYERFPMYVGTVPVVAVLIYAGILATTASYQKLTAFHEAREQYLVQEQQLRAMQERMEEAEGLYDSIRQVKHEMRSHLTNIKGLAENGSYEEMEEYIGKIEESMEALELTVETGNAVMDVIISDKQKAAHRQGIRFISEFVYPESEGRQFYDRGIVCTESSAYRRNHYQPYDVGVIVSNLLQNALEACCRMTTGERYIILRGRQKKRFFLIEVRNSFEGEIAMDKEKNLPLSTKQDAMHGIGLSNVKREVEKYMGDMDIVAKEGEFCVTVMLQGK